MYKIYSLSDELLEDMIQIIAYQNSLLIHMICKEYGWDYNEMITRYLR